MKDLDDKLKNANIDRETKLIIHSKLNELDSKLNKTMEEKQKMLEEKLQAAQGKKK